MAIQRLILETGYAITLCDFYCLSTQKAQKQICKDCEIDFQTTWQRLNNTERVVDVQQFLKSTTVQNQRMKMKRKTM